MIRFAFLLLLALISSKVVLSQSPSSTKPKSNFDTLASQAAEAGDQNRLDDAISLYRKALALKPSWAEGWWSLGTIYYDRDAYADGVHAFQKLVALQPNAGSARVMLGLCEFELGNDDAALVDLQEGNRLGILNVPQLRHVMLYHQGVLLLRKRKFEAAQETLSTLVRDDPESEPTLLALGEAVLQIRPGDLKEDDSASRLTAMRAGRAQSLAAEKKLDQAREQYAALAQEFPDFPNVHYAFGRFLIQNNEADPAVVEFQHEIKNNPNHVAAFLQIAAARYRIDSAEGVKYAEDALKLDPDLPLAHYLLGLLFVDTGNFVGAIPELEIARKNYPQKPDIYFALGSAYARVGRKEDAARVRAEFARLSAQNRKQAGSTVYGGASSAVSPEKLSADPGAKTPQ